MRRIRSVVRVLLVPLGVVALASCTLEPPVAPAPDIEHAVFAASLGINLSQMTKTSDGLYYQDVTAGNGAVAQTNNHVTIRYTGYLTNGTVFDTNIGTGGTGYQFTLGTNAVIKGWEEGIPGMRVGGTRKLVIPASLAYGGSSNANIPANSILVFSVTLVSIP